MWVRGLLLSSLELLLWALLCIVVLAVLLFAECTFVSGLLCSFAFDLLLIATVPPLKFTKLPCAGRLLYSTPQWTGGLAKPILSGRPWLLRTAGDY